MKPDKLHYNVSYDRLQLLFELIKLDCTFQDSGNHIDWYACGKYEAWIGRSFAWDKVTSIHIRYTHSMKYADRLYFQPFV